MPEPRYPTLAEFWRRLDVRGLEPDLRTALGRRTQREANGTPRLGAERGAVAAAVVQRLLPGSAVPAEALAAFLDETFDRQLGRGDERAGVLPTPSLIPLGLDLIDERARGLHGQGFAALGDAEQDALLRKAECGALAPAEGLDWSVWFKRLRGKLLLGYGSDPRGMVQMGFPGPSFRPGHVWLDRAEVAGRAKRRHGYLQL
jgi:hypothetical protein